HALPRELAPGVMWVGDCTPVPLGERMTHSYSSVYVVSGDEAAVLVDTGLSKDWPAINRQLGELAAAGRVAPIKYLFPSHPEAAHSGNIGRLLQKYPEAVVIGETRDYHLVFPGCDDRLRPLPINETFDLGGRTMRTLPALFKDLVCSMWVLD